MTTPELLTTAEEWKERLSDRWWRLNNLYYVTDEGGSKVLFRPSSRLAQVELFENLWFFNIVPKARQLGITTFFAILYLDQVLFNNNKTAGIIAHKQEDMRKIFRSKIRFAWDNLHPWVKNYIGDPDTQTANELSFPNGSLIFVSTSTRSGTVQFLHISEFGYICQKYPQKAEEIVTGAINSVHRGCFVSIESTAAGREGYFYDFCMIAKRLQDTSTKLTEMDFKLFFFPWYIDPKYSLDGNVVFSKEELDYFEMLRRKESIELTTEQKNWYVKKQATMKDKMFQEFPSTLDEAFRVSVEGSYYTTEMERVYKDGRHTTLPLESMIPVDTWWDLGMNDYNVVLLTQSVGKKIHFVDMYYNHGESLAHYYNWLSAHKEKNGYRFGTHNFPHDVEVRELSTGATRREALWQMGMRNIRVGPAARAVGIEDGRDRVRAMFARFWFDEVRCKTLSDALFNYRRDFDAKTGTWKDKHRHDDNSHFADAVRLLAVMYREPEMYMDHQKDKAGESTSFFD